MRYLNSLIAVCLLAGFAIAHAVEPITAKSLEGNWVCVSAQNGSEQLPAELASQIRLAIAGDRMTSRRGEQVVFDGTFTI
jgi:hypothetical protein